ncbi:Syntaxin-18 [Tolypocladium ophioglossoides CBS 100239]|uniref:Syntaxin-18 n=1 Tax=Tolypocladium ophioglossoides (strain CBS 100239) TaxID=1163406 RepID=A0A0L0NHI4_TOLOC|nr:Syntaxin-18 [Tolypocladium ophioglossoides CBS 100239]
MASAILPSVDITSVFNELLGKRGAPTTSGKATLDVDAIEGFIKEAYRINSHITSLHQELRDVRQAYLSTAQPRRAYGHVVLGQPRVLTDREREDVDANAKQMIRELNASIRALDDAEQLRRETESAIIRKKYASGLSALSSWASGGNASKTAEHAAAEAQAQQTEIHRDGVLWFLRQRLELCCRTQQDMMETRLTREMEKTRSLLSPPAAGFADFPPADVRGGTFDDVAAPSQGLTEEQVQMFEEGNQDMMKHYESTLGKVRTAEKSLVEISELQSLLVNNLATQSAHIEQLVTDSFSTTENVGGGNKQLKQAAQRPSAARYTFFAASGLCAFLPEVIDQLMRRAKSEAINLETCIGAFKAPEDVSSKVQLGIEQRNLTYHASCLGQWSLGNWLRRNHSRSWAAGAEEASAKGAEDSGLEAHEVLRDPHTGHKTGGSRCSPRRAFRGTTHTPPADCRTTS